MKSDIQNDLNLDLPPQMPLADSSEVETVQSVGTGSEDRDYTFTQTTSSTIENSRVYFRASYNSGDVFDSDYAYIYYRG